MLIVATNSGIEKTTGLNLEDAAGKYLTKVLPGIEKLKEDLAWNQVRYAYQFWEEGNNRQCPRQAGFVNEPQSIGLKLKVNL